MKHYKLHVAFCFCLLAWYCDEAYSEERFSAVIVPALSTHYRPPASEAIQSIEAEMYNVKTALDALPNVRQFTIPKEEYDRILVYFQNPLLDTHPNPRWPEIGTIKITDVNGTVTRISYYSRRGTGKLLYSIKGIRFIDDNSDTPSGDGLTLDRRLRNVHHKISDIENCD